jgi:hypothetical protein
MEQLNNQSAEADYKINLSNPAPQNEESVSESENTQAEEGNVQEEGVVETEVQPEQNEKVEESTEQEEAPKELTKEEMVNKLLSDRFNVTLEQLPEVLSNNEKESNTLDVPEDVKAYLEYRKETNRPLSDFVALQKGVDGISEDELLKRYYADTKPGLDDSDYEYLLDSNFGYDPENASQDEIKKKTLNKKEEIYKAKNHFQSLLEKYKTPLESSEEYAPKEYKEAFNFYTQYKEDLAKQEKANDLQRNSFEEKTNKFFNQEFEGFDFKVGDRKLVYKPKDVQELKNKNSDLNNFFTKHLDENGMLKDAKAYHTALSMAMNPQSFASFFYEQGKADAVNEVVRDGKNIDMSVRSNAESTQTRPKFRVVEDNTNFGSGLRIKKR